MRGYIFLYFLLGALICKAQPNSQALIYPTADSLKQLYNKTNVDTVRVRFSNELARFYFQKNLFVECEQQAKISLDLARKIKFEKGEANALNFLSLGEFYLGNTKEGLNLAQQSLLLRQKIIDSLGLGFSYNNLALMYNAMGDYEAATKNCEIAIQIRKKLNDEKGLCDSYLNLGAIKMNQAAISQGLNCFLIALKFSERAGYLIGKARASNNIGNVYMIMENFSLALNYFNISYKIKEKQNDKMGMAISLSNIGNALMKQKKYDDALITFKQALKLNTEMGLLPGMTRNYNIIGILHSNLHNVDSALKNFEEALNLARKLKDPELLADVLINMGDIMFNRGGLTKGVSQTKDYTFAEKKYIEALQISLEIGAKIRIRNCYLSLSSLAESKNNFKNSFLFYKTYIAYRDSILNEENTKKIVQSQMQYEFDKKSSADSIKNVEAKRIEKIKHDQEIAQQKMFTYGGVVGFLIMIIVAVISFRAFKNKQKANLEIQKQKEIVEEKQKEILDSIYYARRIQKALMPSEFIINRALKKLNK